MKCLKPFLLLTRNLIFLLILLSACSKSAVENHLEDVFGEEIVDSKSDDHDQESEGEENQNDSSNEETDESDNDEDEVTVTGKMTAKINGEDFETNNYEATDLISEIIQVKAVIENYPDTEYVFFYLIGFKITRYKPEKGFTISLFISFLDLDKFLVGTEYSTIHDQDNLFDEGIQGSVNHYDEENWGVEPLMTDTNEEVYLKINKIDYDKQIISGIFNYTAIDEETGLEYLVTEGIFTDIPLQIQHK
ncbi:hypothetical protein [Pseudozobellia sp. WGM2]|uniref:hypothetical protein n=1 Tax=Pseudozobellia sp. WGM2 TaxID=2787625 RepID=UPI001ADF988E|nr:hypothetical protein [Pseudozobellia sp. WGM2]